MKALNICDRALKASSILDLYLRVRDHLFLLRFSSCCCPSPAALFSRLASSLPSPPSSHILEEEGKKREKRRELLGAPKKAAIPSSVCTRNPVSVGRTDSNCEIPISELLVEEGGSCLQIVEGGGSLWSASLPAFHRPRAAAAALFFLLMGRPRGVQRMEKGEGK